MYKCKVCNWHGQQHELEYDIIESCFGSDKVEVCPDCGSYEVIKVVDNE